MDFKPLNTADTSTSYWKVLNYAQHGWGKTSQAKHYQEAYGSGFIISGESGLSSIRSAGIDYLPFTSWNGDTDPTKDQYSFRDIFKWIRSDGFKSMDYKWIMLDSLTELADHAHQAATLDAEQKAKDTGKKVNGFEIWQEYAAVMIGVCKAIRDMQMHVLVTALAREAQDDDGAPVFWPMVAGKQVQQQLPGIFDCVLCGVRHSTVDGEGNARVERFIVTDEVKGWMGKVRDEHRVLKPVEREHNIPKLLAKMSQAQTGDTK